MKSVKYFLLGLLYCLGSSLQAQTPRQMIPLYGPVVWNFLGATSSQILPTIGTPEFQHAPWIQVQIPNVFQTRHTVADYTHFTQAWYYTDYVVPANLSGQHLYLIFEGAASIADVYVNTEHVGQQHRGAYTRFVIDATDTLKPGQSNQIAIKIDDNFSANAADLLPSASGSSGLYKVWGGLYRKVWLMAVNPVHIDPTDYSSPGIYITPSNISPTSANFDVEVLVRNNGSGGTTIDVHATLLDPNGKSVETLVATNVSLPAGKTTDVTVSGKLLSPQLWAPGSPNLYHVQVDLVQNGTVLDSELQPIGFRSLITAPDSLTLNGQQIVLYGANLHQETEYSASALDDSDFQQNFADMMDLGINCMRFSHYPRAQIEYDLCDQNGIFCWTENGNSSRSDQPGPTADFITTEWVKQNYNHPSIFVWSAGNEASPSTADREVPVIKSLDKWSRPTAVANMASKLADIHGANTYPAWYQNRSPWTLNPSGWISETGAGGVVATHYDYAKASSGKTHVVDHYEPEEFQQADAEATFQLVFDPTTNQKLAYFTWWAMRDFSDRKYKNPGNGAGLNTKGMITYAGDKKDIYYLYRSFLRPSVPTVHITSKRYFIRQGSATNGIKAYSNSANLQLTLNGQVVSTLPNGRYMQPGDTHIVNNVFYWPVQMATGKNVATVTDDHGNTDSAILYFYGNGGTPAIPVDNPLITNITTSNKNNMAYALDLAPQAQWPVYYDVDSTADNTFDQLPPEVTSSSKMIATRRLTKSGEQTDLGFTVTRPANVYVMATGTPGGGVPGFLGSSFQEIVHPDLSWRDDANFLVSAQLFIHSATAGESIHLGTVDRDAVVFVNETGR